MSTTFVGFVFLATPAVWIAALLKEGAIQLNNSWPSSFGTLLLPKSCPCWSGSMLELVEDAAEAIVVVGGPCCPARRSAGAGVQRACVRDGHIAGHDVLARFAAALGGRLHQAIYFDDGDIAAIA